MAGWFPVFMNNKGMVLSDLVEIILVLLGLILVMIIVAGILSQG